MWSQTPSVAQDSPSWKLPAKQSASLLSTQAPPAVQQAPSGSGSAQRSAIEQSRPSAKMPPLLSQVASVVTLQVPSEQQAPVTSTGRHWFTSAQVRPGVKRPPSVLQTIPVSGWHVPPMQHAPSGPSTPQRLSEQD